MLFPSQYAEKQQRSHFLPLVCSHRKSLKIWKINYPQFPRVFSLEMYTRMPQSSNREELIAQKWHLGLKESLCRISIGTNGPWKYAWNRLCSAVPLQPPLKECGWNSVGHVESRRFKTSYAAYILTRPTSRTASNKQSSCTSFTGMPIFVVSQSRHL